MAAQVEVKTGEVGRPVAGGRLHLSPLTDSSNKSLIEISSINQSHIITSEPNKPVPGPKPRLTPKPFAVEKNPTIKPILAPKPQTKPRPESTRLAGYKPELPSSPKPQQPVATGKPRPVSANPNRPAPTSFKTSNKVNAGQTTKPTVQSFKPAPPLDPGDPSKPTSPVPVEGQKPAASSLANSKSLKKLPSAEWSGTTKKEDENGQTAQSKGGTAITRAKSMGFLAKVGQEEEAKEKALPEVPLRPQTRGSRPRPVSAIFPGSPTKAETSVPAPRWATRRPLSADLTSKFESIGLSLHRKSPKADTKENTPEEKALPQNREQDKTPKSTTPQRTDGVADPVLSDQSNKKAEEMKETDEDKRGVSIKSRISLLLDSSTSPVPDATGQGPDPQSPVQTVPDTEPPVGVKQLIKQLTEDTTPTQSPVLKPALKPRPLPLDLTKRFSSERSPDLVSLTEAADRHEISKDPQRRAEESAITPEEPEARQAFGATSKTGGPGVEVQTVRASLFENFVEKHSVLVMDEGNNAKDTLNSPSFQRADTEDEGTLVTATYKEPVSPSSPMRVLHAFDTVQAVEENRVVSESVPSAQWEDKAMTLRSRRSEGSRPAAERTGPAQGQPALTVTPERQPRYLRVGGLQKWTTSNLDQDAGLEKGMLKESQREGKVSLDKEKDRQGVAEQDEVAAAPKRFKTLQTEEQLKPRATYFALTGQMQEPVSPGDADTSIVDTTMPFDEFSVRSALGSSQGKVLPMKRNPSLDEAFGKSPQDQVDELMRRSQMSPKQIPSASDRQAKDEMIEAGKKRELKKETERHKAKMKELEREKQKQLELEKQAHLEFTRMKEREMQREFERQRQKAFEKEKQEFEEKQRAMERQKQIELEKQKLQELEREKQKELEREKKQRALERQKQIELEKQKQELEREKQKELERQRQLEREKRRELERQREIEREKLQEMERQRDMERQRQREEERQRELDKERRLLEIQKEKQRMEELERIKELERQQLAEFQKQKQKEKERLWLESSSLRPKIVDLDSVLRNDPLSKATSQRSDAATRWKEPYKPAILDIDSFTSQAQLTPSKDLFTLSNIQGLDAELGARLHPTPERDVSWNVPAQTSGGFSSPVWTTSPMDPWELRPIEMSVDKPADEPRKHANNLSPEQLLLRQEDQLLTPQKHRSAVVDDLFNLTPFSGAEAKAGNPAGGLYNNTPAEQIWFPRELQPPDNRGETQSYRRSQGSQELNRMRSRSVSRRSAPSSSAVEGSLSRMRSRSAHREQDRHSWVQQKQSASGEEEGKESETPVRDTDSQYGTWETGLRTDDSLTPATPSSDSTLSPSPRKPTPPHTPGDRTSQFETDALDGLPPSSSSDSQPLPFPDAPTSLLDTSALRSRAQLGKKRAPRTRPTRAVRQNAALAEGGATEDWLYRDSTEPKAESKDDELDSEEQPRGPDAGPAVASQPQRIALFPGVDPSALKAQLRKRGDSDNQTDGLAPSPSQLSRSPKSPFLPRAARVLPPPGGKENGEEDSPQWLKELKSKKRLSQYENES
uniref:Tankyrase 1-binding protein C-terminal domain-containing protein n=1 Tax=Amphiprion ocellaris TaxID=80972 RepID=A0AAQ5XWN9_AMPOC